MKKVLVIGCPGSGKSTFARRLHAKTGIPLHHLDMLFWNQDKTTICREEFLLRLTHVLKEESWIIDGNYIKTLELRLSYCDTVIYLDYPEEICLEGIRIRIGKPRADMPWIETEEDASELTSYVRTFFQSDRIQIRNLLRSHTQCRIIIFHSRNEADHFLNSLN